MKNYAIYKTEPIKNFRELLENCIRYYGDRPVFREKDGQEGAILDCSATKLRQTVLDFGAALLDMGLVNGGKVAVLGETSVKWIAAYFATVIGGGVVVPIDKELPENEIANVINDSGVGALVFSPTLKAVVEGAKAGFKNDVQLICLEADSGYTSFDELIERGAKIGHDALDAVKTDENVLSSLLYTSGTTGKSKGVMLSQKNILRAAEGGNQILKLGKTLLSVLPVHHSYEFSHGIVMAMACGATICISDSPRYFLQNLQIFKPDTIFLVPAYVEMIYKKVWANAAAAGIEDQLKALIEKSNAELEQGTDNRAVYFKDIKAALGGNMELLACGGAPLTAFYAKAFRDMGILLLQGYGITECSPLVAVNGNESYRDGAVGVPIGCNEVKITDVDEDGGGDIWVRGDNVMLGYYNNPQATAEVMKDGWFNTGDVGHIDEDGFVFITGRKKNLIVLSNGKNIYPEEIEGYLYKIPYIKEVVVYAKTESGMEIELMAEIFVDDMGRAERTDEQLISALKQDIANVNKALPAYKHISDFSLRATEFEKTTKRSIKRFVLNK